MNDPDCNEAQADISDLVAKLRVTRADKDDTETATTNSETSSDGYEKIAQREKGEKQLDPWSLDYVGVPVQYFSVGLMLGGSTSILFPILVVKEGVTSSLLVASTSVVTIFWSYKIVFGALSDCFPILGWKRKPYIALGWILCAIFLIILASAGDDITSRHLVLMLALANMGYVMADVSADGFMVWIAHREPMKKRGNMQTLVYSASKLGEIFINIVILFGFSGPKTNCPGYEEDPNIPCTTDPKMVSRSELAALYPDLWCHMKCPRATMDWDLSIPHFAWIIVSINLFSLPFYFMLKENRAPREPLNKFMLAFWGQLKRKAAWRIILYSMVSHITFGVVNAAKIPANYVWLNLHTFQHQIMILTEKTVFLIGLAMVRRWALHVSWRKMILCGSLFTMFCNLLYFFIIFNVWRNAWFYIFTDVSASFMHTLNFLASVFCMVEVAEPGYEAITYALITTASNTVSPLSSVVSYQFLAFFPLLNTQESIGTDTPEVRAQFASLHLLTVLINLSSLLALPMLPRQKKETRELVAKGETSVFWGRFALLSALTFLLYSTVVTFLTVVAHDVYGCFKILGGGGCSADESPIPAYTMVVAVLSYSYGVNFVHSFWPILKGRERFRWDMFY